MSAALAVALPSSSTPSATAALATLFEVSKTSSWLFSFLKGVRLMYWTVYGLAIHAWIMRSPLGKVRQCRAAHPGEEFPPGSSALCGGFWRQGPSSAWSDDVRPRTLVLLELLPFG